MVQFFELVGRRGFRTLDVFMSHPTGEYSAADLQEKTKLAKNTLFDSLAVLMGEGLLNQRVVGRSKLYSLKASDPAVRELKKLYMLLSVRKLLKGLDEGHAFLYGSAARGEDTEKSDIDLLVIGPEKLRNSPALNLQEKVSVTFFTPLEYALLRRKDKAFYDRIERDKVQVA